MGYTVRYNLLLFGYCQGKLVLFPRMLVFRFVNTPSNPLSLLQEQITTANIFAICCCLASVFICADVKYIYYFFQVWGNQLLLFLVDPNRFLFVLFVVALAVGVFFFFFCVYVVYTYIFFKVWKNRPRAIKINKAKMPGDRCSQVQRYTGGAREVGFEYKPLLLNACARYSYLIRPQKRLNCISWVIFPLEVHKSFQATNTIIKQPIAIPAGSKKGFTQRRTEPALRLIRHEWSASDMMSSRMSQFPGLQYKLPNSSGRI